MCFTPMEITKPRWYRIFMSMRDSSTPIGPTPKSYITQENVQGKESIITQMNSIKAWLFYFQQGGHRMGESRLQANGKYY